MDIPPLIQITTFNDWEPDSVHDIVTQLNSIGEFVSPHVTFTLGSERPELPSTDVSEWLDHSQITSAMSASLKPGVPTIVLTNHRLNLDYFGDTFPDDKLAIITTHNNYALPRHVLEKQYILYSVTYCLLDLLINPKLWHPDPRGCIFDQILIPSEISDGILSCAICEPCRSALSKLTRDNERSAVEFAERLLAALQQNVARLSKAKAVRRVRAMKTPATNLGKKGSFLLVDRAAMQRSLLNRFGIKTLDTFSDDPDEIRSILNEVTTKMGKRSDLTATRVEELVRLNHTTDIFYLDVDKRHRDHSLHQLYVALFGLELLNIQIPRVHRIPKFYVEYTALKEFLASQLQTSSEVAEWAWYLTAILHDHAYPLSALFSRVARYLRVGRNMSMWEMMGDRLMRDLSFYQGLMAPPLAELVNSALRAASEGRPNADEFEEEYVGIVRTALATSVGVRDVDRRIPSSRYDHGVIGAANLALWAGSVRPGYVESACVAICEHNLEDDILLESQPLSFLLKLCDTLQEWDRIVYPSGGSPVRESERVEIGPFRKKGNGLQIEEPLKVRLTFTRKDVLEQSGWDPERFRAGMRKHLKLLKNNSEVFMRLDEMDVNYAQSL